MKERDNSSYRTEEFRNKSSENAKNMDHSYKKTKKFSEAVKEGIRLKKEALEKKAPETLYERRRNISLAVKKRWEDPDYKSKMSSRIKEGRSNKYWRYSLVGIKTPAERIYESSSKGFNLKYSLRFEEVYF